MSLPRSAVPFLLLLALACATPEKLQVVDTALQDLTERIEQYEDKIEVSPLTVKEQHDLTLLLLRRDSLEKGRELIDPATGLLRAVGWITRLLRGDPAPIGEIGGGLLGLFTIWKLQVRNKRAKQKAAESSDEPVVEAPAED